MMHGYSLMRQSNRLSALMQEYLSQIQMHECIALPNLAHINKHACNPSLAAILPEWINRDSMHAWCIYGQKTCMPCIYGSSNMAHDYSAFFHGSSNICGADFQDTEEESIQ